MIPTIESRLPELMQFVDGLAKDAESNRLVSFSDLLQAVEHFYTPEMMDKIDSVIPGWKEMASYADGQTLIHITTVFVALLLCPEYQQATAEQQAMMKWIVLFHDLAKVIHQGKRDPMHPFRSAALAGTLLPKLSFPVADDFAMHISPWETLTRSASIRQLGTDDTIPDNRPLPDIIDGIEHLFGKDTPAALIVMTVLLHQSINVLSAWPQAAPLTEPEIQRYVSSRLLPLLKMMMLVDNDAWAFFDPETKRRDRIETLAVFRHIESLIEPAR